MLAISMDDVETMKKFKAELKAPFPFVADPDGKIVKLYDVKAPVISIAQRNTFVIGPEMKVVAVQSGSEAIEPAPAVRACSIQKKPGGH